MSEPRLLRPEEAAPLLGFKSRQSVHDLIAAKKLKWVNAGTGRRVIVKIPMAAIEAFIAASSRGGVA